MQPDYVYTPTYSITAACGSPAPPHPLPPPLRSPLPSPCHVCTVVCRVEYVLHIERKPSAQPAQQQSTNGALLFPYIYSTYMNCSLSCAIIYIYSILYTPITQSILRYRRLCINDEICAAPLHVRLDSIYLSMLSIHLISIHLHLCYLSIHPSIYLPPI